ncbi:hypothetical protein J3A83DRAFT_4383493 [Scleroderma citrinum]
MSTRSIHSTCWKLWQVAALPCVVAIPVAPRTVQDGEAYILPTILLCALLLVLLASLAVKHIYMKHRRIKTIHSSSLAHYPSGLFRPSASLPSLCSASKKSVKANNALACQSVIIGCLGDPDWESRIKSRVDEQIWMQQQSSLGRSLRVEPMSRGRSMHSNVREPDRSSAQITNTLWQFGVISSVGNAQTASSTRGPHRTIIHTGEGGQGPDHTRPKRRSFSGNGPSIGGLADAIDDSLNYPSIRLVENLPRNDNLLIDGPPGITLSSPLMAARDSLLLSRCHLGHDRKPLPPLPPLAADSSSLPVEFEHRNDPASTFSDGFLTLHRLSPSTNTHNSQSVWRKPDEDTTTPDDATRDHSPFAPSKLHNLTIPRSTASPDVLVYATEQIKRRHQHNKLQSRAGRAGASPLRSSLTPRCMEPIPPLPIITAKDKENDHSSAVSVPFGGVVTLCRSSRLSEISSLRGCCSDFATEPEDLTTSILTDETAMAPVVNSDNTRIFIQTSVSTNSEGIDKRPFKMDCMFGHSPRINDSALTQLLEVNDGCSSQGLSR